MFDLFNQDAFNQLAWCFGITFVFQTVATMLIMRYVPKSPAALALGVLVGLLVFVGVTNGTAAGAIGAFIGGVLGLSAEDIVNWLISLTARLAWSHKPGIALGMAPTYVDEFNHDVSRPGEMPGCEVVNFANQDRPVRLTGHGC